MSRLIILAAVSALLAGCVTTDAAEEPGMDLDFLSMMAGVPKAESDRIAATLASKAFGSADNPIRVYMPEGERAYLSRLRCANGRAPTFERIGSFGLGPYRQIIDGYQVDCVGSTPKDSVIYMDMYHAAHEETRAPEGFTIVP